MAKKALELAEANPGFRYQGAPDGRGHLRMVYVADGEGSCLFGRAMVALGVDPARLEEFTDVGILHTLQDLAGRVFVGSADAELNGVQHAQDTGQAWGSRWVAGRLRRLVESGGLS